MMQVKIFDDGELKKTIECDYAIVSAYTDMDTKIRGQVAARGDLSLKDGFYIMDLLAETVNSAIDETVSHATGFEWMARKLLRDEFLRYFSGQVKDEEEE